MPIFHDLRVSALEPLTDDAIKVTLEVPDALREEYRFVPGQHLTFAHQGEAGLDPADVLDLFDPRQRRAAAWPSRCCPAGCSPVSSPTGCGSAITLSVMTPAGRFSSRGHADRRPRTVVAIVAGSGITPVMSIMTTLLETEPETRFVLCYGSRRATSVMFAEEIADLKDRFLDRLEVFHMISSEAHAAPLLSGRIDADRLEVLLRLHPAHGGGRVVRLRSARLDRDRPGHADRARSLRRRHPPRGVLHRAPAEPADGRRGRARTARSRSGSTGAPARCPAPEGSVLDAVLTVRPDAPFACRNGVCGTCRMRVVRGEVAMAQNFALEPSDLGRRLSAGLSVGAVAHPSWRSTSTPNAPMSARLV